MENGAFWKQLTLPVALFFLFLSIATVACMLWYSESNGVVFRIWGQDFSAVKNTPNVDGVFGEKIISLEKRISELEKAKQQVEVKSPESTVTKPINKTRILNVGQGLKESTLPFSVYVKSASGGEGYSSFLIDVQTPESPLYTVKVTKGWSRNFEVGARSFTFSIVDVDKKLATMTVLLKELNGRE